MSFHDFLIFASIIAACFSFPVYLLIRDQLWERTSSTQAKQPPSAELQKQAELELKTSETELICALTQIGVHCTDDQEREQELTQLLNKPTTVC